MLSKVVVESIVNVLLDTLYVLSSILTLTGLLVQSVIALL